MKNLMALTILFLLIFMSLGCGNNNYETFGTVNTDTPPKRIRDILAGKMDGKTVSIEGEITAVCPAGCWFTLEDESVSLHIDLAPNGLAIPQKKGCKALVTGKVIAKKAKVMLQGSGVMIK